MGKLGDLWVGVKNCFENNSDADAADKSAAPADDEATANPVDADSAADQEGTPPSANTSTSPSPDQETD